MPIITNVRTILTAPEGINLIVVKVETDQEGLYGLGCATFAYRELAVQSVVDNYLKPLLVNRDVHKIEDLWHLMHHNAYWRNDAISNNAISGVDMALWDIKGKIAGLPVYDLLGGKSREGVPYYRHVNGSTLNEVVEKVETYKKQNVKHIRIQWGLYGGIAKNLEVWRALETLYDEEVVGAIGVSNFDISDLEKLLPFVRIKPHINQLGIFVGHTMDPLRAYCEKNDIVIQGHSPLARGRIFQLNELQECAMKHEMSSAQIAIRYVLDKNVYPIVKASTINHLKENLVLNMSMPEGWTNMLDQIHQDVRDYKPPYAKRIL